MFFNVAFQRRVVFVVFFADLASKRSLKVHVERFFLRVTPIINFVEVDLAHVATVDRMIHLVV
jgi:hypothetical protein